MAFVIDTNVALEWLLREPRTPVGRNAEIRARQEPMHGPLQLWAELHTGLLKRERAGVLDAKGRDRAVSSLDLMSISYHAITDTERAQVLGSAADLGLTIYDAFFLDTSLRLALPLATNDRALRRAATLEGVPLV